MHLSKAVQGCVFRRLHDSTNNEFNDGTKKAGLFFPVLILSRSKASYSQWPEPVSCPGLPPVAGDAKACHMSTGSGRIDPSQIRTGTQTQQLARQPDKQ